MERVRHYRALGASVAVILRAVAADLPDSPVTRHQVLRLKREDNWPDLRPSQAPPRRQSKPFDPPPPGYIHCDTIIGPTADCPVIFTARERASGMCWAQASREKTSAQAAHFLTHVVASCPLQIHTVLTDNGSEFMKDFVARAAALGLVHRHTRPRRPQTNGMVERFNGLLKSAVASRDQAWWWRTEDRPTARDLHHQENFGGALPDRTVLRLQTDLTRWTTWMNLVRPDLHRGAQSPLEWLQGLERQLPGCFRRPTRSMVPAGQLRQMLDGLGGHRFLLIPPKNWSLGAGLTGDH